MFHIDYNNVKGFFNWIELRCLCRAIGFQPDIIYNNLPKEVDKTTDGMSIKELMRIINLKYLDMAMDKTFNAHTADWNLCVVKKALVIVDYKILSYQELHDTRISFCMYENPDMKGMLIDEITIMRCLKMCGRVISPLKMHHRLKHMSQSFDEEGRIQLYEFLDLILWTEIYDEYSPEQLGQTQPTSDITSKPKLRLPSKGSSNQDSSSMHQIDDFHSFMQHYDERLAKHLDRLYLQEEWSFGKEEFSKTKLPNELPVNREFRLSSMKASKMNYRHLKKEVTHSQNLVHVTSTGHIRPRPLTAPNVEIYNQSERSSTATGRSQKKLTITDLLHDYLPTPYHSTPYKTVSQPVSRPHTTGTLKLDREHSSSITQEEMNLTESKIQDIKFCMSTIDNRYDRQLLEEMNSYLPDYKPQAVQEEKEEKPKKVKRSKSEVLQERASRLAYSPYRPDPKYHHSIKCDARFRGWHKVKSTKGKHFILTTMAFARSPVSQNLEKLHISAYDHVKSVRGECLERQTSDVNVRKEIQRPTAAPEVKFDIHLEAPIEDADLHNEEMDQGKHLDGLAVPSKDRAKSGVSLGTSSNRTYSFRDFRIYDEHERQKEAAKNEASEVLKAEQPHQAHLSAPVVTIKEEHESRQIIIPDENFESTTVGNQNESIMKRQQTRKKVKDMLKRRSISAYTGSLILKTVA